jgi:teichoic acid transport system permease protein
MALTTLQVDPQTRTEFARKLDPAARAAAYGLGRSGARPPLPAYVRQVWRQRNFVLSFATAETMSNYAHAKLGQVWQLLTPLLNSAVYYLVFGELLHTHRGVKHFLGFLVTGYFVFTFSQQSILSGSKSISGRLELIRALHFPRACLPLGYTISQLQQLGFAAAVFIIIDGVQTRSVAVTWLWLVPILLLLTMFNAGVALIVARLGARTPDVNKLMPFLTRTWMYCSGTFYNVDQLIKGHAHWLAVVFGINPAALFMDATRTAMGVPGAALPSYAWWELPLWSVGLLVVGFIFFWRDEEQYGRG